MFGSDHVSYITFDTYRTVNAALSRTVQAQFAQRVAVTHRVAKWCCKIWTPPSPTDFSHLASAAWRQRAHPWNSGHGQRCLLVVAEKMFYSSKQRRSSDYERLLKTPTARRKSGGTKEILTCFSCHFPISLAIKTTFAPLRPYTRPLISCGVWDLRKLRRNLWLWQWRTKVYITVQMKVIFHCRVSGSVVPSHGTMEWERITYRFWSNALYFLDSKLVRCIQMKLKRKFLPLPCLALRSKSEHFIMYWTHVVKLYPNSFTTSSPVGIW